MNTQQGVYSLPMRMNHTVEHYANECAVVIDEFCGVDCLNEMTWRLTGTKRSVDELASKLNNDGVSAQIWRGDDLSTMMIFWLVI